MSDDRPKILVVDDDRTQRQMIRLGLEPRGFIVLEADNGRSGLEAATSDKPDLVLLDMRMPVLDGLGFLSALDVATMGLPVMVVSGVDDVAEAAKAFKLGAVDYVQKPVRNFDVLERSIHNALARGDLARKARLAEERYHTLVENVPMVVFLMDGGHQLSFVSRHLEVLLQETPAVAQAEPGWLLSRTLLADQDRLQKMLDQTLTRQDRPRSVECRLARTDGTLAHCLVKVIPLGQDVEGRLCVEGVILDITDRVALEKFLVQREKLKTVGSITAGLAHEIRNPLMAIGGFARRLRDKYPDAGEAGIILDEAMRLEELLSRILGYLNPVKIKGEECSVNQTLVSCLELLGPELEKRGLTTHSELCPESTHVREDPEVLEQVIVSLVRQMTLHLPDEGSITLRTFESAAYVHVEAQSAYWPALEDPDSFFLPFDQAGAESGLPFARRMLGMMGGALGLEERDGEMLITVTLPKKRERVG